MLVFIALASKWQKLFCLQTHFHFCSFAEVYLSSSYYSEMGGLDHMEDLLVETENSGFTPQEKEEGNGSLCKHGDA